MSIRSLYSDLLDGLESAAQSTGSGAVSSEAGLPRLLDDAENDQVDVTAPSSLAQERHADQLQPKASTGRKRKIVDVDVDEEEDDDENDDEGEDEESGDDLGPESIKNDAVSGDQVNPYYEDVDGDIESYILSPEEQAKRCVISQPFLVRLRILPCDYCNRASIWEKSFRGFVEERAARRAAKLAEEAARHGIILDENGTDSAGRSIAEYNASHNLYLTKTGKWRKKTQRRDLPVDNVSQAVLGGGHGNVLTPAVKSKKINYEVLKVSHCRLTWHGKMISKPVYCYRKLLEPMAISQFRRHCWLMRTIILICPPPMQHLVVENQLLLCRKPRSNQHCHQKLPRRSAGRVRGHRQRLWLYWGLTTQRAAMLTMKWTNMMKTNKKNISVTAPMLLATTTKTNITENIFLSRKLYSSYSCIATVLVPCYYCNVNRCSQIKTGLLTEIDAFIELN